MRSYYDRDGMDCPNAYFNGSSTSFCVGSATDDVVAHEWAHGYTQETHGLVYAVAERRAQRELLGYLRRDRRSALRLRNRYRRAPPVRAGTCSAATSIGETEFVVSSAGRDCRTHGRPLRHLQPRPTLECFRRPWPLPTTVSVSGTMPAIPWWISRPERSRSSPWPIAPSGSSHRSANAEAAGAIARHRRQPAQRQHHDHDRQRRGFRSRRSLSAAPMVTPSAPPSLRASS